MERLRLYFLTSTVFNMSNFYTYWSCYFGIFTILSLSLICAIHIQFVSDQVRTSRVNVTNVFDVAVLLTVFVTVNTRMVL